MTEEAGSGLRTALVVDDDPVMRILLRETLESIGIKVADAPDGEACIAAFERARPDIVLLDVMMPGLDGYAVCRRLRALPSGTRTPILMVTGLENEESITSAYEAGATDFVTKPISWPILAHRVRYILRSSDAMAELARSQANLAQAQRIARLGSWEWDRAANSWRFSAEACRIFGLDAVRESGASRLIVERAHADDRERVGESIRAAVESQAPLSLQYRIVLPDGAERTLDLQGEVEFAEGPAGVMRGTVQDVTERERAAEKIRNLAFYDPLTGLPNRALFREQLGYALVQAERHDRTLAILFLDLDNFKRVNDTLGHSAGDALLEQVARRLMEVLRSADRVSRVNGTPNSPQVARMGGDEFIVLLTQLGHASDAAKVTQRILDALRAPFALRGHDVVVSASIGIALYPNDARDQDALLMNADMAMYHAKERGRNSYQFYSKSMNATAFERLSLESDLRKALEREELTLFYQPKIDICRDSIVGVEALLRWTHPELGMVSPAQFIPVAEQSGLIKPIGEWVLATACRQIRRWQDAGFPPMPVAVNMSSVNFRDSRLLALVSRVLGESGIHPGQLELEVTESVLMNEVDEATQLLKDLKEVGVRLAIDDFGTGYSSLSYLKRFPLDTLKIDRSFVKDIATNAGDKAITAAIVALGRNLGVEVVAEGVETHAQAEVLRALGCSVVQGFLYSRPVPTHEFEVLLHGSAAMRPKIVGLAGGR